MKNLNYFVIVYALCITFNSCHESDSALETPECIEEQITLLKNKPAQNPVAEVWAWKTDTDTYYYITSDCCDQFNYLYNSNCTIVCAPDGGFTGTGDGKCPDLIKTVSKNIDLERTLERNSVFLISQLSNSSMLLFF